MMRLLKTQRKQDFARRRVVSASLCLIILSSLFIAGCSELNRAAVEPFYSVTTPPPKQELRWSNGRPPESLDPARALAAPETDVVRAIYEGLTDLDSRSLREIPGVAERWESSADLRTWTFHLRNDARWSNGDRITASDFVRSWKRLSVIGQETRTTYLYQNITGMLPREPATDKQIEAPADFLSLPEAEPAPGLPQISDTQPGPSPVSGSQLPDSRPDPATVPIVPPVAGETFGAEAVDAVTLRVSLHLPDKDFPKLVSNPIFRPVHAENSDIKRPFPDSGGVTNGAFRIVAKDETGITLEKDENYWNARSVALERVRFVAAESSEAALEAYRRGEVDVVTNAAFEPVGLKLLTPYEDFRQTTHSALNFYEFNTAAPPFSDRRVREALALSIDRERLADGDLEGTTHPAARFFPMGGKNGESLTLDIQKAAGLLRNAGYTDGSSISPVRLVINRNNTQQRIARSVARMWKQNLNLDTEIIVKEAAEIADIRNSGEFDLVRRGVVLPTNDELVNLESIFGSARKPDRIVTREPGSLPIPTATPVIGLPAEGPADKSVSDNVANGDLPARQVGSPQVITEADALFELMAIPLYYPISYSLIKPYVSGFEMNGLDAPSLKEVSVDSNWQPRNTTSES